MTFWGPNVFRAKTQVSCFLQKNGPGLKQKPESLQFRVDQVNLCRVFKLAREVAASGKPLNYQVMPMMDAAGGTSNSWKNAI